LAVNEVLTASSNEVRRSPLLLAKSLNFLTSDKNFFSSEDAASIKRKPEYTPTSGQSQASWGGSFSAVSLRLFPCWRRTPQYGSKKVVV